MGAEPPVGRWHIPYGEAGAEYLECGGEARARVAGRAEAPPRYTLSLQWRPERSYSGPVTIRATITVNNTTWVNITSSTVTVHSGRTRGKKVSLAWVTTVCRSIITTKGFNFLEF